MRTCPARLRAAAITLIACTAPLRIVPVLAQTPEEHAAHHASNDAPAPGRQDSPNPTPADSAPAGVAAPAPEEKGVAPADGDCSGNGCGSARNAALYAALMALPDLPPEQRAQIDRDARNRMIEGAQQMSVAAAEVAAAFTRDDFARLQDATSRMDAALGQLKSGLAARRALAEGQAPRSVALSWFRRELNLADPIATTPSTLSSFHYSAMALLALFAMVIMWLYVARIHRVRVLLGALRAGDTPLGKSPAIAVDAPPNPAHGPETTARASRVPAAVTGNWAGKLRVARIFQETPTVRTFRLAPVDGAGPLPFLFEPGQFLTVSVAPDGKPVRRSYSIASSPCCQGFCDITVKREASGVVSSYLHERVQSGDILELSGPYGQFTFRGHEAPSVVFIAGGVGITPLMSSIRYLTDQSWEGRIDLIYACAQLESVIFREELQYLSARHPNLHITLVLSDERSPAWSGQRGFVNAALLQSVPDIRNRRIHVCGPPAMMTAIRHELAVLGVAPESIRSELFLGAAKNAGSAPVLATSAEVVCSFARSGKKAPLHDQTVLEVAESVGVPIEYACRQGYCGVCKVKLLEGDVTMAIDEALTPADKASRLILACQAKATANITVDA